MMNWTGILLALPKLALLGTILAGVVIGMLSLLPGSELPSQTLNDKLNHFIAYGVLSFGAVVGRHRVPLLWVMALVIGYGLALEVLQGIMPYDRSASWLDAFANTGGVFVGSICGLVLARILPSDQPHI